MAKRASITWYANWLPPPKHGKPGSANGVSAERGVKVVIDGLHEYAESVLVEAKAVLLEETAAIHKEAVRDAPSAMGQLRQNIRISAPSEWSRRVGAGGAAAPHAPFLEYGTRSGAPSVEKIELWMKRKGITPLIKSSDEKRPYKDSAFAIRKKIMRSGIKAQPFLFPAFERHRQPFINKVRGIFK